MTSNAEQSQRTRAALVAAGRELFGARGYANVGTEEVVARAGVTRGALYHQFRGGKQELFRTVFEDVERDLLARLGDVVAQAGARDPLAALKAGAEAFLDAGLDEEVQRIVLLDAPSVLGWELWRELGAAYGLGLVKSALAHAMQEGAVAAGPVDPLAHVLVGALDEAVLYVARAADPAVARAEVGAVIGLLVEGLRA
jgi:AcrR family transcriptional regulator